MSVLSGIADLFFPPKCVFCGKILKKSGESCLECADELSFTQAGGRREGDYFDFCVSPLYYEGNARKSMLRYKFRGAVSYAEVYGPILAECIREHADADFDIVSWVPLNDRRKRKRGYDQAMLLAEAAARDMGEAVVRTLIKPHNVKAQSEIQGRAERRANIDGAYAPSDSGQVRGKRVLLIDDIITTGSTLEECARVLLSAGAERVICATLCTAVRTGDND